MLRSDGDGTRFHSELEYLDRHIPHSEDNELLSCPIKADRWLMEGLYQRAWELLNAGLNIPEFDVFNKTLMNTIRDEIAHSTEMAYQWLISGVFRFDNTVRRTSMCVLDCCAWCTRGLRRSRGRNVCFGRGRNNVDQGNVTGRDQRCSVSLTC